MLHWWMCSKAVQTNRLVNCPTESTGTKLRCIFYLWHYMDYKQKCMTFSRAVIPLNPISHLRKKIFPSLHWSSCPIYKKSSDIIIASLFQTLMEPSYSAGESPVGPVDSAGGQPHQDLSSPSDSVLSLVAVRQHAWPTNGRTNNHLTDFTLCVLLTQ